MQKLIIFAFSLYIHSYYWWIYTRHELLKGIVVCLWMSFVSRVMIVIKCQATKVDVSRQQSKGPVEPGRVLIKIRIEVFQCTPHRGAGLDVWLKCTLVYFGGVLWSNVIGFSAQMGFVWFVTFWVGLEITSFCTPLASHTTPHDNYSNRCVLIYFIDQTREGN